MERRSRPGPIESAYAFPIRGKFPFQLLVLPYRSYQDYMYHLSHNTIVLSSIVRAVEHARVIRIFFLSIHPILMASTL